MFAFGLTGLRFTNRSNRPPHDSLLVRGICNRTKRETLLRLGRQPRRCRNADNRQHRPYFRRFIRDSGHIISVRSPAPEDSPAIGPMQFPLLASCVRSETPTQVRVHSFRPQRLISSDYVRHCTHQRAINVRRSCPRRDNYFSLASMDTRLDLS